MRCTKLLAHDQNLDIIKSIPYHDDQEKDYSSHMPLVVKDFHETLSCFASGEQSNSGREDLYLTRDHF